MKKSEQICTKINELEQAFNEIYSLSDSSNGFLISAQFINKEKRNSSQSGSRQTGVVYPTMIITFIIY